MIFMPSCRWDERKVLVEDGLTHAASFEMRALSSAHLRLSLRQKQNSYTKAVGKAMAVMR